MTIKATWKGQSQQCLGTGCLSVACAPFGGTDAGTYRWHWYWYFCHFVRPAGTVRGPVTRAGPIASTAAESGEQDLLGAAACTIWSHSQGQSKPGETKLALHKGG